MNETSANVKVMSIYEALGEIKLLDKEIRKMNKNPITFFASIPQNADKVGVDKLDEATKNVQAWFQKYMAKCNRLNLLQGLVYETNNKTPITVNGVTYNSVTMALQRYKNIQLEEDLYCDIVRNLHDEKNNITCKNEKISDEESIMKKIVPAGMSLSADEITALKDRYLKDNTLTLFDPLGFDKDNKAVDKLEEIRAFKERFHIELNKVNLMTMIEVPVVEPKL